MVLNRFYLEKYKELWAETSAIETGILVNINYLKTSQKFFIEISGRTFFKNDQN